MKAHRPLIVANWKANLPAGEEVALAGRIATSLPADQRAEIVIAPSSLGLVSVTSLLRREHATLGISTAAQDCSVEEVGAHTGEEPAAHLVGIAASVIVGHSERRRERGESDALVGRKLARVVLAGLRPILCVGDDLRGADTRERAPYLVSQWRGASAGAAELGVDVSTLLAAGLVVAYEPIWAIGSGVPATAQEARHVARTLREAIGADLPVLYGGSVDAVGASSFLAREPAAHEERLDGLLVGGASLDATTFASIVVAATRA